MERVMGAAAAPVGTERPRASAPAKTTAWWQQKNRPRDWWCKEVPYQYFLELVRRVSGLVEFGIVGVILCESKGGYPRASDWAAITEEQFAEVLGVTVSAIQQAMARICVDEKGQVEDRHLVQGRKVGRHYEYRALAENFDKAPERAPRSIEKKPVQAAEEPRHTERPFQPFDLAPGAKSKPIALGGELRGVWENRLAVPVSIDPILKAGIVHFTLGNPQPSVGIDPAGNPHSSVGISPRKSEREANGNPHSSVGIPGRRRGELREWLAPLFVRRFNKTLDEKFLDRIEDALGTATSADLRELTDERFASFNKHRQPGKFKSGLLLDLAASASDAAVERARLDPPKPPAEPKFNEVPHIPPADDFDSPWARIKLRLQKQLSGTQFSNWFMRTAFSSLNGGELRVCVPDEPTRLTIEEDYAELIAKAIRDLKLSIERVVYCPRLAQN
jgi:hypothetical protein